MLVSWSLTTPVGGYPDDAFHFANTWCDDGLEGFKCSAADDGSFRRVPNVFTDGSPWWEPTGYGEVFGDFSNSYPRFFYSVTRLIAFDNVVASVFFIRLFNSLVTVFMLAFVLKVSQKDLRFPFVASWLVVGPSLLFYYTSSNHPMAWSYLAVGTGWVFAASIILSRNWRCAILNATGLTFSVVLAIGARPEGQLLAGLFLLFGVVTGLILRIRQLREDGAVIRRGFLWTGPPIISVLAVLVAVRFGSSESTALLRELGQTLQTGIWTKLIETPYLYLRALGSNVRVSEDPTFGIQFPISAIVFGAIIMIGFSRFSIQNAIAIFISGVAAFLAPYSSIVDSRGVLFTPPRYLVPFIILLVASFLIGIEIQEDKAVRAQWKVVSLGLFVAHALALHGAFRPFIVGESVDWKPNLNDGLKWWWQVGPSPVTVWIMGSLAFGYLIYSLNNLVFKQRVVDA